MGSSQERITGLNPLGDGEIPRAGGESNGVNVTRGPEEVHSLNPEAPNPASVEVRFGDPVDAPRLHELFTDPTTVEHLQGIVPFSYEEEGGTKIIPATTVDDIRKEYRENPNLILLTAEDPSSGRIIGTCTVEKKGNVGEIGKLAVDSGYRKQGIANKLLRSACALIFNGEDPEGLNCRFAEAFVIINIDSDYTAQRIFANMYIEDFEKERGKGFLRGAEREQATYSWSNELGRLVDRNSQPMTLTRKRYIDNFPGLHKRDLPKGRRPR